jgi:uncharacterized LabA/DUF88 family protein
MRQVVIVDDDKDPAAAIYLALQHEGPMSEWEPYLASACAKDGSVEIVRFYDADSFKDWLVDQKQIDTMFIDGKLGRCQHGMDVLLALEAFKLIPKHLYFCSGDYLMNSAMREYASKNCLAIEIH